MEKYNKNVEPRWQDKWRGEELFRADDNSTKPKKFILDMFPYPSGEGLHVGHVESYTATDIYSRYLRMNGFNVLHPQGWDAFGLPAENYAIKTGTHPSMTTQKAITTFKKQIDSLGFSYDWSREVNSSKPDYYKWTQWLFLLFYKNGLAYKKKAKVNWCASCQTVLANEQAEDGKCERCGSLVKQKDLKQWFFRITDFIEDQEYKGQEIKGLLSGLGTIDWPESTKSAQTNWIGKSEGAKVTFKAKSINGKGPEIDLSVFTTRPDTLFGCTYMVVNPEHELIEKYREQIINIENVDSYISEAKNKSDIERTDLNKDKTGVELAGLAAVNPVNNEEIPIFVADYVLAEYGTGAIMAVPAHDARDYEFAKNHDQNIVQVVRPKHRGLALIIYGFEGNSEANWFPWAKEQLANLGYEAVVLDMPNPGHPELKEWLDALAKYKDKINEDSIIIGHSLGAQVAMHFVTGLDKKIGALYLVAPTTKMLDIEALRKRDGMANSDIASLEKIVNKPIAWAEVSKYTEYAYAILSDNDEFINLKITQEYLSKHDIVSQVLNGRGHFQEDSLPELMEHVSRRLSCFAGEGISINSPIINGLKTSDAKHKIIVWLEKNKQGELATSYKMRDWLISRQRYWGAPIPIIYCAKCGEVPVPVEDLPVALPNDVDFKPTGESPLINSKQFHDVKCPVCKEDARRESDTMDTFVCSSWYYLRYSDPKNDAVFASEKMLKQWLPVDVYVGGAEHTVLHLLYSRFFTKALQKFGLIDFNEPFLKMRHQGIILSEDGTKMSKSKGNVVNPDTVVSEYGADALRLYEMFMGPLEDMKPWNTKGIIGIKRFLDYVYDYTRVWKKKYDIDMINKFYSKINSEDKETDLMIEKTVKKVSEDMENFKFNTAISQMMICFNFLRKSKEESIVNITKPQLERLLLVLAPFAPHLGEELWHQIGHIGSIFKTAWPKYSADLAQAEVFSLVVQVNGQLRDKIEVSIEIGEAEAKQVASESAKVKKWIEGKEVVRVIFVPGKLINFVVKD